MGHGICPEPHRHCRARRRALVSAIVSSRLGAPSWSMRFRARGRDWLCRDPWQELCASRARRARRKPGPQVSLPVPQRRHLEFRAGKHHHGGRSWVSAQSEAPGTPHICPCAIPPYKFRDGVLLGDPGRRACLVLCRQGVCLAGPTREQRYPSVPPSRPTPLGSEPVGRLLPFPLLSLGLPLLTLPLVPGGGQGALGGPSLLPRLIMQTWASLLLGLQNHYRW